MNDDFLHRIRKTPPPEFLAGLKDKLDQQPMAPPPRRRWTFTRGLLAGLLLGGAAYALTAVSLTGGRPGSLRTFVSAPVQFLARLMPGGSEQNSQQEENQHRAVPLGPVWLPNHPVTSAGLPDVPTQPASLTAQGGGNHGGAGSVASRSGSVGGGTSTVPPASLTARVVAWFTSYPLALSAADHLRSYQIGVERAKPEDAGETFDRLCSESPASIDVVQLARRPTAEELSRCTHYSAGRLVEVKYGYQAVALARARLYGPLRLTAHDLFLALAQRVPDPTHPGKLLDNPYTTWNQVDPALPYDPIEVIGPDTNTSRGQIAIVLLLRAGCNSYPWIAALRDSAPDQYDRICGHVRKDGVYVVSPSSDWAYSDLLETNPTALGVFSLGELSRYRDALVLNPVDGVEPNETTLAAGTYPAGETLYLYANKKRMLYNQAFQNLARFLLGPKYLLDNDQGFWAFVRLDDADLKASLDNAQTLKEFQF